MKEKHVSLIIIAIAVMGLVLVQSSNAQGLLGKRYIGFEIGQVTPGDDYINRVDNSILILGSAINIPVNPNVDAAVRLSYAKLSGHGSGDVVATGKGVIGGINYHFAPDQKANPFVGIQMGFVSSEVEVKSLYTGDYSTDDTDFAISIGVGAEVDFNDQVAIRSAIAYNKVGDDDDFGAGISVNIWFNESIFGALATSYAFDSGDVSYSVGSGFAF